MNYEDEEAKKRCMVCLLEFLEMLALEWEIACLFIFIMKYSAYRVLSWPASKRKLDVVR